MPGAHRCQGPSLYIWEGKLMQYSLHNTACQWTFLQRFVTCQTLGLETLALQRKCPWNKKNFSNPSNIQRLLAHAFMRHCLCTKHLATSSVLSRESLYNNSDVKCFACLFNISHIRKHCRNYVVLHHVVHWVMSQGIMHLIYRRRDRTLRETFCTYI